MKQGFRGWIPGIVLLVVSVVFGLALMLFYAGSVIYADSGAGQATVPVAEVDGNQPTVHDLGAIAVVDAAGTDAPDAAAGATDAADSTPAPAESAPGNTAGSNDQPSKRSDPPATVVVHVDTEAGLLAVVEEADSHNGSITIALEKNIDTSQMITIPSGADITLTGAYQLKRTNNGETLRVASGASLTIDGITVTHSPEAIGSGILAYGSLNLSSGLVFGNNGASGGGIFVASSAVFTMTGGEISDNSAENGGGIYIDANAPIAISNATISNNTATASGGGIWIGQGALSKLNIAAGVAFSGNSAATPYDRLPADDGTYAAQVQGTSWTSPLAQGYNNYDISYIGQSISRTVSIASAHAVRSGNGSYGFGDTVSIDAGARHGYHFAGWTVDAGGAVLADPSSPQTSFSMPATDVALTANWALLAAPLAPRNLVATPTGDCQVTLTWTAPQDDGGSPITNYDLSKDGGATWTRLQPPDPAAVSYTFTGLATNRNGSDYVFAVRAINATGEGVAATAASRSLTTPDAPRDFTATAGNGKITLSWGVPEFDGGSPITGYELSTDGGANWVNIGNTTSHTVTGLTNGTAYSFVLRAVNGISYGSLSRVATATPSASAGSGSGMPQTGDSLTGERLILMGTVIGTVLSAGLILLFGGVAYRRRFGGRQDGRPV
jgi:uncharacterized repeat protein (TIGR02543 family)